MIRILFVSMTNAIAYSRLGISPSNRDGIVNGVTIIGVVIYIDNQNRPSDEIFARYLTNARFDHVHSSSISVDSFNQL